MGDIQLPWELYHFKVIVGCHFLEIAEAVHENLLCEQFHEGILLILCFEGNYVLDDVIQDRDEINNQMEERLSS